MRYPVERGHHRVPPAVRDLLSFGREDEQIRATVGGVRHLPEVAAPDQAADVVPDGRGREAGLRRQSTRSNRLKTRHPAEERELLVREAQLVELLVDEEADQQARRVQLLEEVGVLRHVRIIGWTYCEFVAKLVRVRRYWRTG
jgi:hypothetical protein